MNGSVFSRLGALVFVAVVAACSGSSGGSAKTPREGNGSFATSNPTGSTTVASQATTATTETAPVASLSSDSTVSKPPPASTEPPPASTEPPRPAPFPTGTVVLHVGSSTATALGRDLKRELESNGVKCVLEGTDATYIPQWAGPSMGLKKHIDKNNPDLVIVSLGGNETAVPNPEVRADPIRRIVKIIGNRPCVWVGTPRWKAVRHTGILDVIQANIAPCVFVDSDLLAPNLKTIADGVHPTVPERRRWARRMLQWLQYNRDPEGSRPWDFRKELLIPPPEDSASPDGSAAP